MAIAAAGALLLSGCAAGQISQTAQQVAAINGGNANVGNIGVRNAMLQTPDGAAYPRGSSAQLITWLSNAGNTADQLVSVSSPIASNITIEPQNVPLPPRSLVEVGPAPGVPAGSAAPSSGAAQSGAAGSGGTVRVTFDGLADPGCYGKSIPVMFAFRDAGQVTLNIPVEDPVERTGSRPTINIQPEEEVPLWNTGAEGEGHGAEAAPSAQTPSPCATEDIPAASTAATGG
ncbi:hypothetical protein [Nakamurella aerolata]|uniref:hypothetical protein n=1 Tax=Nakamurella aerolata TaxID=1656892 RepID=UPI0014884313|nr:hypothetical protein [Nakamurella aerolata]